jgi:hypothetical protein
MANYTVRRLGNGNIRPNQYNKNSKYFSVKKVTNAAPGASAASVANAASGAPGAPGAAGVAPAAPGQLKSIDPASDDFKKFKKALEREQLPWLERIADRSKTLSPKELQSLKKKVEQNLDKYKAIFTLLQTFSNTHGETNEMVNLLITILSNIHTNIDGNDDPKGSEFLVNEMLAAYVYHQGIPALFVGGKRKKTLRTKRVKRSTRRMRSVKR